MIKFSVVIPTYNRKLELNELLISLKNQTYKHFEVLICDDGSTDDTYELINSFVNELDIKYFLLQNSGGPASPRNHGIAKSKYDWICFVDSDDLWTNNKLEVLSKEIAKTHNYIYCHKFETFGKNSTDSKIIGKYKKGLFLNDFESLLYNGSQIVNSSICINKKIITHEKFFDTNECYHGIEDYIFLLNLTYCGIKIKMINKKLGFYRIHESNISSNAIRQVQKLKYYFTNTNFKNVNYKKIYSQIEYLKCALITQNKVMKIKSYGKVLFSETTIEIRFKSFMKLLICLVR